MELIKANRIRIQSVVAGGLSKKFLGKEYTLEKIEKMDEEAIEKLNSQYEAIYSSLMTKELKSVMIGSFSTALKYFVEFNKEEMDKELNNDVLIDTWLSTAACNMYHTFGTMLVPLTTSLKVLKHINIHGGEIRNRPTRKCETEDKKPEESCGGDEECGAEEETGRIEEGETRDEIIQ